jgi:glycosyltransferase involved in cell wall biosynthesis
VTIYTFYSRGNPALSYLYEALAAYAPMRNFWPAEWIDVARLAVGRARLDPNHPTPLLEWKSLVEHGARIARDVKVGDTVIFNLPSHAVLLPAFEKARKVYYLVDDYRAYTRDWQAEDELLLKACDHVIAVSPALGGLLEERVPGIGKKLTISPNAVPDSWVPSVCPTGPAAIHGFSKAGPIVGIIGSISSRLRLDWLVEAVEQTPQLSWLFVGDVEKGELLDRDKTFLDRLDRHSRCYFTGPKRYEQLLPYARALDVALMPYSERSTNPFGSAMRLFMHLPFGQPIIATPGCKMVESFVPLVKMADGPRRLADLLNASILDDGLREARWQEAQRNTWKVRAAALRDVLIA